MECEELRPGQECEPLQWLFRTMDQRHLKRRKCGDFRRVRDLSGRVFATVWIGFSWSVDGCSSPSAVCFCLVVMYEDLLGYLLGALEPEEMQRVSQWLKDNPEGQRQLEVLRKQLGPLDEGFEAVEAPSPDLLDRTLDALPGGPPPDPVPMDVGASDQTEDTTDAIDPILDVQSGTVTPASRMTDALASRGNDSRQKRWNLYDCVVGLVSVVVLLALLLPTIAAGRFEARRMQCADQLRELGSALTLFASSDPKSQFPAVADSGPEAFAGVYRLRLQDRGLIPEDLSVYCPSTDSMQQFASYPPPAYASPSDRVQSEPIPGVPGNLTAPNVSVSFNAFELPTVDQLRSLTVDQLKWVQQVAGGDFAYSLGVMNSSGYSAPKFEGRQHFAILADAPLTSTLPVNGSAQLLLPHGDRGINVLYEDGRVEFVLHRLLGTMDDHPFLNHEGRHEAGVTVDDASLSRSPRAPFVDAVQR